MSIINQIISYENGELEYSEVLDLFYSLVKSGQINHLQGSYQRTAQQLIESGELQIND